MKGAKGAFVAIVCLWVAAGCQQGLAQPLSIFGATPDFLLIAMATMGLFCSRQTSTVIGFFAGLLQGAIAGASLGSYVVTRTVSGFLVGWFNAMEMDANIVLAFIVVATTTLVAQFMLLFLTAPPGIGRFVLATIESAVYNGVLAMPFYALLQKILDPPRRL